MVRAEKKGMKAPQNDKKFVDDHVSVAISSKFFGEMRIKFEAGRVVVLKKEESFKPK